MIFMKNFKKLLKYNSIISSFVFLFFTLTSKGWSVWERLEENIQHGGGEWVEHLCLGQDACRWQSAGSS